MAARIAAIHVPIQSVPQTVDVVQSAERAGVRAVWLSSGGFRADSLTTLAVIAAQTERILIGTSIAVTYSRHPVTMVQQATAIDDLAPGRLRLGIGTGHRATIERAYGLAFDHPYQELRGYVEVLRQAATGQIHHDGEPFRLDVELGRSVEVPVYISALRPHGFRLAAELADGAIAWATPAAYLRDVVGPAMRARAEELGRTPPRLVGHLQGLVTKDPGPARNQALERLAANTRMPYYQAMFALAGHPEARDGSVPIALFDDVVAVGETTAMSAALQRFYAAGCDEVIVSMLPGSEADWRRTFEFLADQ